jgi:hypothetical protein
MEGKISCNDLIVRICIDKKDKGQISGRAYCRFTAEPFVFTDAVNLILQLEHLFDEVNFPRAFKKTRKFPENKPVYSDESTVGGKLHVSTHDKADSRDMDRFNGNAGTFLLMVTSRQNATWQGYIDWLNGSAPQKFRTVLELLKMIIEW